MENHRPSGGFALKEKENNQPQRGVEGGTQSGFAGWGGDASPSIDYRVLGPGHYSILVDGHSYEVFVREKNGGYQVDLKGHLIEVLPVGELGKGPSVAAVQSGKVKSPMPGRVIGIKVTEGDVVKQGDGLIVVEAMKMENELASPKAGKVSKIVVKVGQTVEAGQELVVIE
ncbi:MAG: biotin/lipoyl-binding protein [Deltaproteobacteria bacterium]|nr:biotin/lipoyl-binding protein [Deltaproteobacteria bacterium]